jgi:polyhydroxyalkanoate synthesis regulator phasin
MYQGSIGKIINRATGDAGWYQKLRCIDDIYFVNIEDPHIKIKANHVDESTKTNTERNYYVVSEIIGENVVECGNYKIDESKIIIGRQIQAIQKSLQELKKQKQSYMGYLCAYENYKNQDTALTNKIEQLEKTLGSLNNGDPIEYTYVYGKHTADSKEYCWILPYDLLVSIGSTVEVDTVIGIQKAIVTRIEKSFEYKDHKSVIRAIE